MVVRVRVIGIGLGVGMTGWYHAYDGGFQMAYPRRGIAMPTVWDGLEFKPHLGGSWGQGPILQRSAAWNQGPNQQQNAAPLRLRRTVDTGPEAAENKFSTTPRARAAPHREVPVWCLEHRWLHEAASFEKAEILRKEMKNTFPTFFNFFNFPPPKK